MTAAVPESPADDPALIQAVIANYEEATGKIREVAKWFATSGAALAALLVGTSPLAGIDDVKGGSLFLAILCAVGALGALGWLVLSTSNVLAPKVVELDTVAQHADYANFRETVRKSASSFLGAWEPDVPAFKKRRDDLYGDDARLQVKLREPSLGSAQRAAFEDAREIVQLSLRRSGWVAERLLAAAENYRTWEVFKTARQNAFIAIGICAVAVGGFLATAGSAKSAAADAAFSGPLPVRVSLTDAGRTVWGSLLGEGCPTTDFEALLTEGGQSAPWSLMVTDTACTTGVLELTAAQGAVLVRSATG